MNSITITKTFELLWEISGMDGYCFASNKKLYNIKTGKEIRKTLNGGCVGYWIGKKFLSLNKIRPLLIRPKLFKIPF